MVNQSGGHWVEPWGAASPAVARSSESIVQNHCARCHQTRKDGAPKIGDRAAWTPRLRKGLDPLVASAIHGHGGMPARGGLPDLSDEEVRGAIVYMFNHGLPVVAAAPTEVPAAADPRHKTVSGTDKELGLVAADNSVSYGSFFHLSSGSAYNITADIRRPGVAGPIQAKFEFKAP
jgi:cytochrome c5